MKRLLPIITLLVAGFTSTAEAQPLMNYTYADAAYQWIGIDQQGYGDSNGLDSKLSYSPVEHFALEGGYNYLSTKFNPGDIKTRQHLFTYGGAGWYSVCKGLDLVGRVGGVSGRLNYTGDGYDESFTDNGVYAGGSVRYLVAEEFEADLNVTYQNLNSSSWLYSATGLYAIHENIALKGDVGIDNDKNVYLTGGFRFAM